MTSSCHPRCSVAFTIIAPGVIMNSTCIMGSGRDTSAVIFHTNLHFKCIFLNENMWISIKVSLKFIPEDPINTISAPVHIIARRQPGEKPLSESMMVSYWRHSASVSQVPTSCIYGTWWRHQMETFSALLAICAGNSPVTGEFPAQRPVTRSFDVFFDLGLNKRLSKQSWG